MQTITDLVWTLMISLQFTSFVMIVITHIAKLIVFLLLRNTDKKITIKVNPIWYAIIVFSTFYLMHM